MSTRLKISDPDVQFFNKIFQLSAQSPAPKEQKKKKIIISTVPLSTGMDMFDKNDKVWTLRKFVNHLIKRVQLAYNTKQEFVVDESMIAILSKYCPFLQKMMCKPIKCGVKVFCLVFCKSKYLYNWKIYQGKRGIESDEGYVERLMQRIIPEAFNK